MARARPSVLVVEDDPTFCGVLVGLLQAQDIRAIGRRTIAEARESIGQITFDAAIIDGRLPDGRGDTLLHALAQLDTPWVLMTGYSDLAQEWRQGGKAMLEKPFELDQLIAAVMHMLGPRPPS